MSKLPHVVARSRRHRFLLALSLTTMVVLAAACTSGATVSAGPVEDPTTPAPPTGLGDDATILAVLDGGGLVPVEVAASNQPRLVISADGTVHRPAPATGDGPGPVVPDLERTTLDQEERDAVLEVITDHAAELTRSEGMNPAAADLAFTQLTVLVDDRLVEVTVPAIGDDGGADQVGSDPDPLGVAVGDVVAEVEAIVEGADRQWTVGSPAAVRITSISYDEEADPGVGPAVDLPFDAAPLAPTEGYGCLDLSGDELDAFTDAIERSGANADTPWATRGRLFRLIVRPVYAHERPCSTATGPGPALPTPTTAAPIPTTTPPAKPTPSTSKPPPKATADGAGCVPGSGALGNGHWFGYFTEASPAGVEFDLACWFSGQSAVLAAAEDGRESPPPNDFYIRNTNPATRTLHPGAETPVVWYPEIGDPGSKVETTFAEWLDADRAGAGTGVWVTISAGTVTGIAEQWTP